jgi:Cu-Zn family superoxide dismutase
MKNLILSSAVILSLVVGCKPKTDSVNTKKLSLTFEAKSDSKVSGTASFVEKNGQVVFVAKLSGLKPGAHAIHEKADCSSADGKSAGGHWNPTFKNHGKWGSASCHKGDIGNFIADKAGNGTITLTTSEWCIGCGDATKDILGKGLIVHQDPDDFTSQPAGNAGARVACSAIIKE